MAKEKLAAIAEEASAQEIKGGLLLAALLAAYFTQPHENPWAQSYDMHRVRIASSIKNQSCLAAHHQALLDIAT